MAAWASRTERTKNTTHVPKASSSPPTSREQALTLTLTLTLTLALALTLTLTLTLTRYSSLRGTSVLATRLYLDTTIETPHTANACWGFDAG